MTSVNKKIFNAALLIAGSSMAVKIIAALKDFILAAYFGTQDSIDAFLIAFLVPSIVINVVAASLSNAIVPRYSRQLIGGDTAAAQLFVRRMLGLACMLFLVIGVSLFMLSPWIVPFVGRGFNPEKLALTSSLYVRLLPLVLIAGLGTLLSSILNTRERFMLPALSAGFTPIFTIGFLIAFHETWGVHTLVYGALCGFLLQVVVLFLAARDRRGIPWPVVPKFDSEERAVMWQFLPLMAGSFLMCCTDLVDQVMAAAYGSGSVATISYGNKLVSLVLGVGSVALSTAIFPYFSRMVAAEDWRGVRHTLKIYIRLILITTVPLAVLICWGSEPLVRIFFQRGSFTEDDTMKVALVQTAFALQIPFYVLTIMFVRLISSLGRNSYLLFSTLTSVILNIVLNYVFLMYFGLPGIALSTAVVYMVSALFLGIVIAWKLPAAPSKRSPT